MILEKLNEHKLTTDELKSKLDAQNKEKEALKRQNWFMIAL